MFHVTVTLSNFRDLHFDTELSEEELTKKLSKKLMKMESNGKIFIISTNSILMTEIEEFENGK